MIGTALANKRSIVGLINDDALVGLRQLPSATFNVVVTSPPYYWARDYGLLDQLGHEDTVEQYITTLASIFDEVRRVLHPEGVFYLNIGDTYYSGNGQPHGADPRSPSRNFMRRKYRPVDQPGWDLPKKSLIGIPWKLAFEMQKRGWTLRSDIVWNRHNAFAEPTARDRPHRQYEHVFLFSKSRFYSYDRTALEGDEDVWTIPIGRERRIEHNAPFPVELAQRCILTGSPPGGYVLDPFVGSGTSLIAALQTGRSAVGIDLSRAYCEEVIDLLKNKHHCTSISWQELESKLSAEPTGWSSWKGNKANYRKPGTKREAEGQSYDGLRISPQDAVQP